MSSYAEISERFHADFESGVVYFKVDVYSGRGRRLEHKAGDVAGSPDKLGYLKVKFNGKALRCHRLVYALYHKIDIPDVPSLDHINRIKSDNRLSNLRPATHSSNMANRDVFSNSSTGFKGVSLKPNGKYEAYAVKDKVRHYLGVFNTPEEAHAAYLNKAKEIHGEFCYDY